MVISRTAFFLTLMALVILPLVAYKAIWLLRARKVTGVFAYESRGNALEQIRYPKSEIFFLHNNDTFWLTTPGSLSLTFGDKVTVRYLETNPAGAKLDSFKSLWGGTVVYGGIPVLILLAIALHPEVVPYRRRVRLLKRQPFIQLV